MMKLAVLQRIIRAGEQKPNSDDAPAKVDVWQVARTIGGDYLEYDPEEFSRRILACLKIRIREFDKERCYPFSKKVRKVDRLYTPDEVTEAFKRAWNDVTKAIKTETIKVL